MKKAFAEIIESSLDSWLVQSWKWDTFPQFGSLVVVEQKKQTLFGIVHTVQTGSMDPNRYPFAYQKTEEELLREQPQIFEFLKTTFSCITIGYKENGKLYYHKAPEPPKIHAFVRKASKEELQEFFADERYLHALFSSSGSIHNIDELLLALLKTIEQAELLSERKITKFIEQFSLLTGNDYRRLKLFMQRL
jgi:hypothetical protein